MRWEDVPDIVDEWAVKVAASAAALRRAAANIFTSSDVGYYYNPVVEHIGFYSPDENPTDLVRCKTAAARVTGLPSLFLTYQDLADTDGTWVKVAYSPTLRRAGELLNFFPGQLPGGVPNAPSPLAAILTSGLLGAGLGYGGGKILSSLLPRRVGHNLGRTGLLLGAALGAAPGAAWAGTNVLANRSPNDPTLLAGNPDDEVDIMPNASNGGNMLPYDETGVSDLLSGTTQAGLGRAFKSALDAYEKSASTFAGSYAPPSATPMDVNINALGQTMWDLGATPTLTAATMAGVYAARQLPDPRGRPGWATSHQLGQLAQNAAGDYATGLLVGAALNGIVGTPLSAPTYGLGNMALGIVGAVVPKLFGG